MQIVVGARGSKLSQAQVKEVYHEITAFFPKVYFSEKLVQTKGDRDQKTSLLYLDKTNFFTDELDEMLINGECDIAVHSAKDLPDPLPPGLEMIALTKGVSSKDCLIFREGEFLTTLPKNAKVGCSSLRRVNMLQALRKDFVAVDIRGDILKRLNLLENKIVDALIMAHAAIIRLNLKLNMIILEGDTASYQGQLAVLSKKNQPFLKKIFSKIDVRTL